MQLWYHMLGCSLKNDLLLFYLYCTRQKDAGGVWGQFCQVGVICGGAGAAEPSRWGAPVAGLAAGQWCKESKSCAQRGYAHPAGPMPASQSSTASEARGHTDRGQEALVRAWLPGAQCRALGLPGLRVVLATFRPQNQPQTGFCCLSPSCFPSWEVLRGHLQPGCG